jgi:glycosyltransferase involved in cell wall biosynthesis
LAGRKIVVRIFKGKSSGGSEVVSVIIPTYNSDRYICEAIDSVLCQTYHDYEIIVIDDGSTDDTGSTIAERYPMVRYYFVENKGAAAARNLGISKAQGKFIAFLDADDRWLPTKLEKQVSLLRNDSHLGMVFAENSFFNERGTTQERVNKRDRLMNGDIVRNIFLNSYVATPTVMVLKSVFEVVGLFEEDLVVAEDDNMWMRIGMKYGIELIDEPLVECRITEGSLSRKGDNIFLGVKKNMEIIKNKYPEIYYRLGGSSIRMKFSDILFSEGYGFFFHGHYLKARHCFIESYIRCPFKLKPLLYMISTFLPTLIIDRIRLLKGNIRNSRGRDGII